MTIFFATLLVAAVLAIVLWPFFAPREGTKLNNPADDLRQSLRRGRERVYEEIKVLQQEHFMHDLTDEAYQAQLQELRLRAAGFMREQEGIQDTLSAIDAEVDQALRQAIEGDGEHGGGEDSDKEP